MVGVRIYLQKLGTAHKTRVDVGDDYRIKNFVRSLLLLVVTTARVASPHLLNVCIAKYIGQSSHTRPIDSY